MVEYGNAHGLIVFFALQGHPFGAGSPNILFRFFAGGAAVPAARILFFQPLGHADGEHALFGIGKHHGGIERGEGGAKIKVICVFVRAKEHGAVFLQQRLVVVIVPAQDHTQRPRIAALHLDDLFEADLRGISGVVPETATVHFIVGEEQPGMVRMIHAFALDLEQGKAARHHDAAGRGEREQDRFGEGVGIHERGGAFAVDHHVDLGAAGLHEIDFVRDCGFGRAAAEQQQRR